MCKQVFLTNTSKLKLTKLKKLLKAANEALQSSERDGFGWVMLQADKSFVGERYVNPTEYQFKLDKDILKTSFTSEAESNVIGKLTKLGGPLLIHGRTSTNDKNITNTHPFIKNGWALVHNGVVENDGEAYTMQSTCDSEHLIQHMSTVGLSGIERHITGYYAFGAIDSKGQLHVVKDSIAGLHVAYIKSIESFMFATTKDLIEDICEEMSWKTSSIEPVKSNLHLVFKQNELLSQVEFTPRGRSSYADKYKSKSLGYLSRDYYSDAYKSYGDHWGSDVPSTHQDFSFITKDHVIIASDGTELDLEDFQWLPESEKLKCCVLDKDGTQIMFKTSEAY